jgi:hypothetical protein
MTEAAKRFENFFKSPAPAGKFNRIPTACHKALLRKESQVTVDVALARCGVDLGLRNDKIAAAAQRRLAKITRPPW